MLADQHKMLDRQYHRPEKKDGDVRNVFQRDKARIMHSAAFRRLQAKTQVLGIGISDFYRTRLTHSLEAAQIGTGIAGQLIEKQPLLAQQLDLNEHLIESLCLAHDIGHPPFGHGGEVALHCVMSEYGGFEGNAQTFRIVTKLETYSPDHGMNLARRTLLGLVKYPNYINALSNPDAHPAKPLDVKQIRADDWHPPKGLFDCDADRFDWVLAPFSDHDKQKFMQYRHTGPSSQHRTEYKSFDCSIMELADDIAYGIHDLEDAIVMSLVNKASFDEQVAAPIKQLQIAGLSPFIDALSERLFSQDAYLRKRAIGALVNAFITAIDIQKQALFEHDLLDYQAKFDKQYDEALNIFKRYIFIYVINKSELQILRYKGQQIVISLFEAFNSEPTRFLPVNTCERWKLAAAEGQGERIISDYISGMTDEYASRLYGQLFLPNTQPTIDSI